MRTYLIEGYVHAVEGLWAAVKLFWPIWMLSVALFVTTLSVGNLRFSGNFKEEPLLTLSALAGAIAFIAYNFIIFCQGAVGWHRRLLRNERARWISPIPQRRSLQYALPAFLFIFIMFAVLIAFGVVVLPRVGAWYATSTQGLQLPPNPTLDQLEAYRRTVLPINLFLLTCNFAIMAAVIWAGRSWLMAFPHVSVRTGLPMWGAIKKAVPLPHGFVGAVMVTMFLPSLVRTLYQSFMPLSVQLSLWATVAASVVNLLLVVLSLLCGLSILSIAYRRAQVDQIAYQAMGDTAQGQPWRAS